MTTLLRKIQKPDRSSILGLVGLWAMYLALAAVMALATGDTSVFFTVGFQIPGLLAAVLAFAVMSVAIFVLGIVACSRAASRAYHRHLRDRFRFHLRGPKARFKAEDRHRTAWGLLADTIAGLALGLGLGGVICAPFVATQVLAGRLPPDPSPWLTGLSCVMLATSTCGSILGLMFRVASAPLLVIADEKPTPLPPPVDDEFF